MSELRAMGVNTELEAAINEAWNVAIPSDVPVEEFWQLSIAKDARLVELYSEVYDLVAPGAVSKMVIDARNGRRDSIKEARRELWSIEEAKRRNGETVGKP